MAFINEMISEENIEKHHIKEIDKEFLMGQTNSEQWTIDYDRGMYLRCVARGRFEYRHQTTWTFYWHGVLLVLRLDLWGGGGDPGQPGWSRWVVKTISYNKTQDVLTPELEAQRPKILLDLKEALLAYKDFGIYSTNTDYEVILES
ncbi:hypothetical protein DTO96_102241 [Ephemeroptericola cinctiostellae]|uniref:Uncharacterized protein n=1 Tax=Ephemeroptericola cinctiostellae TaxID=2268024 RepID=A0A345DDP9_9BURK|nr:hypothetical protein [Ephemeroptericola cinctiostellae]AXF86487.1 hypothetical protein DTO96_102241 [Ephemeroptericola cinctiostellae]